MTLQEVHFCVHKKNAEHAIAIYTILQTLISFFRVLSCADAMVDIKHLDPSSWAEKVSAAVKDKALTANNKLRCTKLVYGPDAANPPAKSTLIKKYRYDTFLHFQVNRR